MKNELKNTLGNIDMCFICQLLDRFVKCRTLFLCILSNTILQNSNSNHHEYHDRTLVFKITIICYMYKGLVTIYGEATGGGGGHVKYTPRKWVAEKVVVA